MPEFTVDWFDQNIDVWNLALVGLKDKPIRALEIGSFEGRASLWLLNNILTHPAATLVCVDTWEGSQEHKAIDMAAVQQRFERNLAPHIDRVDVEQTTSVEYLMRTFNPFDLIYIDGSHTAADVLTDAVLAHRVLKPGGILIFDDYLWRGLIHDPDSPKAAIDAFIECFAKEYDLVASGYQVILRKKDAKNQDTPQ